MATPNKTITVLARYFVKLTFAVVYLIVNGGGKRYIVTLNANGTSACIDAEAEEPCEGCKHGHTCYHKLQVMAIEGLRGAYLQEYGSLAGFRFVAPVVEKKARFERPETVEAMSKLVERLYKTSSIKVRDGICALFAGMADSEHKIRIGDREWYFDADIHHAVEIAQIVPQMTPDCPLPELPAIEEVSPDFEEFTEAMATVWAEEARVEELTPQETIARVSECLRQLAFVCDGARDEDGMGFNGMDAAFGHELAAARTLTPRQLVAAARMLKKYNRTQLGGRCPSVEQVEKALERRRTEAPLNGRRAFSLERVS